MITGKTYRERCNDQLSKWVDGNPEHNDIDGECCPDFSCCDCQIADKETRIMFRNADDELRHQILMGFLGDMLSQKKVYIAGQENFG